MDRGRDGLREREGRNEGWMEGRTKDGNMEGGQE